MARNYRINGETMVRVKNAVIGTADLGLAAGPVVMSPRFFHHDVRADDFGPHIPPETLWMLADVTISMTLVHYDSTVLANCISESMAGGAIDGTLTGAGAPMGGGANLGAAGNHYISLSLLSPVESYPWRFAAAYLANQPFEYPLGTEKSLVQLRWRAIPYVNPSQAGQEIVSNGAKLWDHIPD